MRAAPADLERKLNYTFTNPELLRRSLIHSSLANEIRAAGTPATDNEQLEFLGDSILGFLVAEALVLRFPGAREGELSRQKAHLVSAAHLHGVARRLDLGSYLELGRSEEMSGGRAKKTLLVDLASIPDPGLVSLPAIHPGDVGLGNPFRVTCESVEAVHPIRGGRLVIGCDNNFPNTGRNPGRADDNEFIVVKVDGLSAHHS